MTKLVLSGVARLVRRRTPHSLPTYTPTHAAASAAPAARPTRRSARGRYAVTGLVPTCAGTPPSADHCSS